VNLQSLETESRNGATCNVDLLPTEELVAVIHREDARVAEAIHPVLPIIARAVDEIADALRKGGRLFYIGAGTSGRLGILDAAECPPTFNTSPELVQALIAGGTGAIFQAIEGAEDDPVQGGTDLQQKGLFMSDIVVGLAASGRTPYVTGALRYARGCGCRTIAIVCVKDSELAQLADVAIAVPVGAEVITGSTRMKAGTAQKMILNMLSTATMIKLGKTYSNWMVDVRATNDKLTARVLRMVGEIADVNETEASTAIKQAGGSAKIAIVMLLGKVTAPVAETALSEVGGFVRQALLRLRATEKEQVFR
jgi:N-acetylmuramic acid 6-phosphate etherase